MRGMRGILFILLIDYEVEQVDIGIIAGAQADTDGVCVVCGAGVSGCEIVRGVCGLAGEDAYKDGRDAAGVHVAADHKGRVRH